MKAIFLVDLLGTFAFSITGIIGGIRHRLDIIGAFFLAFVTAMGGGMIRDMLLGVPSHTFNDPWHIGTVLLGVIFTYLFIDKVQEKYEFFICLDALGLSVFTVIGIETAISLDVHFLGAILAGMLTAVGGGVIRDTLIGDIPLIFHKEVYATASLLGGAVFYCLHQFNVVPLPWNIFLSSSLIFVVRLWGYKNNVHMPRFYR
ncbi:trimeric intracellular cation channel family protein [Leptolyngbya ohadii]|uniref:trimeric intracellular cation channel family protein n=1 Tax=Leptolyngbya ohadii TaxID=1962290 RepID=UPI000B59DA23|nr:trimeric intracellular cation channel family protein [Leptolyngbya ohadii]